MYYVAPYPTEHRLRSAIIFIFFFEILGCIYQFVAHIWAAAIINVIIAIVVAFIGLTAAYRKSEGGLLFYAILQMISVVLQLANGVWIILEVFFLAGRCESGWHCHGWHHARGWPFAIFVLSVISTLLYLFLKIYAAALALRLRDQVHSAHIAEAFVAPRPNEAAYQSSYQASQPSYLAPPRSPVVARPDVTTYGTSTA